MKIFNVMGVHRKIRFLGGRGHEKPIYRRKMPKKGRELQQFADLRRGFVKKRRVVFLRWFDTPVHTM